MSLVVPEGPPESSATEIAIWFLFPELSCLPCAYGLLKGEISNSPVPNWNLASSYSLWNTISTA